MTLFLYNLIWKILVRIVPSYLKFRIKSGKEDNNRIKERFGIPSKKEAKVDLFGYMGLALVNQLLQLL